MRDDPGPLDRLIKNLAVLPGLGPRSARRIALQLLSSRERTLRPLIAALEEADERIHPCAQCGNLDLTDPCRLCNDPRRDKGLLCVVAGVADLWAVERTGAFRGLYHVLGGVLSAMDGVGPGDLRIEKLLARAAEENVREIIIALSATVDGQATAHYLTDRLLDRRKSLHISRLAHGVPVGGELDYLDDGTIATALTSRAAV
jgi:recombination protein RecR